jgi:hypothetical protein
MNSPLPPLAERDVPPTHHARLRAGLLRDATTPRRPGWAVPALAAAVTALLVSGAAAVPMLRHHGTQAAALPATYLVTMYGERDKLTMSKEELDRVLDKGGVAAIPGVETIHTRIWDPASRSYRIADSDGSSTLSPDGRWVAICYGAVQEYLRVVPAATVRDDKAGRVGTSPLWPAASTQVWAYWADDSSVLYAVDRTAHGFRLRTIDPARHAVTGQLDLAVPGGGRSADLLRAGPHTGFSVLGDWTIYDYDPAGKLLRTEELQPPPLTLTGAILSPDRKWAVGNTDKADLVAVDLGTGAVVAAHPGDVVVGPVLGWRDPEHYFVYDWPVTHTDVLIIEAATGRVVTRKALTDSKGALLGTIQVAPLAGPPPPGAITF